MTTELIQGIVINSDSLPYNHNFYTYIYYINYLKLDSYTDTYDLDLRPVLSLNTDPDTPYPFSSFDQHYTSLHIDAVDSAFDAYFPVTTYVSSDYGLTIKVTGQRSNVIHFTAKLTAGSSSTTPPGNGKTWAAWSDYAVSGIINLIFALKVDVAVHENSKDNILIDLSKKILPFADNAQLPGTLGIIDLHNDHTTITYTTILPKNGTATVNNGSILYTPNKNFVGTDVVYWASSDSKNNENDDFVACVIFISVKPVLTCSDVSLTVDENSSNNQIDLSSSIKGWDNSASLTVSTNPSHGISGISGEIISYTPVAKFIGSDTLKYSATNTQGTATCNCNITITRPKPICPDTSLTVTMSQYPAYLTDDIISALSQNILARKILMLYDVGFGDRGYGQGACAQSNADKASYHPFPNWPHNIPIKLVNQLITYLEWIQKIYAVKVMTMHQGIPDDNSIDVNEIQQYKLIKAYPSLLTSISNLDIHRMEYNPINMEVIGPSIKIIHTSDWHNTIKMSFTVTFDDGDEARYYFNSGGQVRIFSEHHGGDEHDQSAFWSVFLSKIGMVAFSAEKTESISNKLGYNDPEIGSGAAIGYYQLSKQWQRIFYADGYTIDGRDEFFTIVTDLNKHSVKVTDHTESHVEADTLPIPNPKCPDGCTEIGNGWGECIDTNHAYQRRLPYNKVIQISSDPAKNPMYPKFNSFLQTNGVWVSKNGTDAWLRFDVPVTILTYFTVPDDCAGLYQVKMAGYGEMDVYVNGVSIWTGGQNWTTTDIPHVEVLNLDEGEYLLEMTITVHKPDTSRTFNSAWPGAGAIEIDSLASGKNVYTTTPGACFVPWVKCKPGFTLDYHDMTNPCKRKILVKCGDCLAPETFENPAYGWSRIGNTGYQAHITQMNPIITFTHTTLCTVTDTAVVWHPILVQEAVWPSNDGINPDATKNKPLSFGFKVYIPHTGTYRLECSGTDYCRIMIGDFCVFVVYSGSYSDWYGQDGSITFPLQQGYISLGAICYHWSWDSTAGAMPDDGGFHALDAWVLSSACVGMRLYDDQNNLIFNTGNHTNAQMEHCSCAIPYEYDSASGKCIHRESVAPCKWDISTTLGPMVITKDFQLTVDPAPGVPAQTGPDYPFDGVDRVWSPRELSLAETGREEKRYDSYVSTLSEKIDRRKEINNCCLIRKSEIIEAVGKSHNSQYEVKLKGPSCYNLSEDIHGYYVEVVDRNVPGHQQDKVQKTFEFFVDNEEFFDTPTFEPPFYWYFGVPKRSIKGCNKEQYLTVLITFADAVSVKVGFYINGSYGKPKSGTSQNDRGVNLLSYLSATQPITVGGGNKKFMKDYEFNMRRNMGAGASCAPPGTGADQVYNPGHQRDDLADHSPEPSPAVNTNQVFRQAATTCFEMVFPPFDKITGPVCPQQNPSFDHSIVHHTDPQAVNLAFAVLNFKIKSRDSSIISSLMTQVETILRTNHVQYVEHYSVQEREMEHNELTVEEPMKALIVPYKPFFVDVRSKLMDNYTKNSFLYEIQTIINEIGDVQVYNNSESYLDVSINSNDLQVLYDLKAELETLIDESVWYYEIKTVMPYLEITIPDQNIDIINELELLMIEDNITWFSKPTEMFVDLLVRGDKLSNNTFNEIINELETLLHETSSNFNIHPIMPFIDLTVLKINEKLLPDIQKELLSIIGEESYEVYDTTVNLWDLYFDVMIESADQTKLITVATEVERLLNQHQVLYESAVYGTKSF